MAEIAINYTLKLFVKEKNIRIGIARAGNFGGGLQKQNCS